MAKPTGINGVRHNDRQALASPHPVAPFAMFGRLHHIQTR